MDFIGKKILANKAGSIKSDLFGKDKEEDPELANKARDDVAKERERRARDAEKREAKQGQRREKREHDRADLRAKYNIKGPKGSTPASSGGSGSGSSGKQEEKKDDGCCIM